MLRKERNRRHEHQTCLALTMMLAVVVGIAVESESAINNSTNYNCRNSYWHYSTLGLRSESSSKLWPGVVEAYFAKMATVGSSSWHMLLKALMQFV